MKKLFLYYNTIKYLKPIQVWYQLYYRIRKIFISKIKQRKLTSNTKSINTTLNKSIFSYKSFLGNKEFIFLNQKKSFSSKIDWNYDDFGKLWAYNLNYFEFLNQKDISFEDGKALIDDFNNNLTNNKIGLEPFPTSLRIINWIKFLLNNKCSENEINNSLFNQANNLLNNIEFHIQGNHLLENAFALLFAGIYFNDKTLTFQGENILQKQLKEQILDDGAHFEFSPMYHQHMLFRVLDTINIINSSNYDNHDITNLLVEKAEKMKGWLEKITFSNGEIPHFNDSAIGIAPSSIEILEYSKRLNISSKDIKLSQSGYRVYKKGKYELIIDIGKIGPDYIPGHGHCDMFSFVLYISGKPIIVDTGTSVYGGDPIRRSLERSTTSHNTVKVGSFEQSEVWSDFRVARRSFPSIIEENSNAIEIKYKHFTGNYTHIRRFDLSETIIVITDIIDSNISSISNIHFAKNIKLKKEKEKIFFNANSMEIQNGKTSINKYFLSNGFSKLTESIKAETKFFKKLKTVINISPTE